MYEGNPGEIDFGSIYCKVRVSQGSSYREATVHLHAEVAVNGRVTRIKIYQLINVKGTIKATGDGKICMTCKLKTNKDKAFHC